MSYLLFLDESGHDHRTTPYEVRGGIALHAAKLWTFVQAIKELEVSCYGAPLHEFGSEVKGHRLLDKDRFKWVAQADDLDEDVRRSHALALLNKGTQRGAARQSPTRAEFTAYGQASLQMAHGIFTLLRKHDACLFAAAIPRRVKKPPTWKAGEFLRKDQVFLLERFFYFLEDKQQYGLLVMDETEKQQNRRFVRRLERYFTVPQEGRHRTARIVPSPFFVSSEMTYPIQAADVCIYCVNHGYRLPTKGMDATVRKEIESEFGPSLTALQYRGEGYREGEVFQSYGIVYVDNPYGAGSA